MSDQVNPKSRFTSRASASSGRRRFLQQSLALAGGSVLAAHSGLGMAQANPKILIGYWPIAGGLPFYCALQKGYFKEAGLDVEGVKFASATQVVEAMIAERVQGSANGTASAALGLGEITAPGLFSIIASNPSNASFVLDEFVVAMDSPIKSLTELKGKRVASGPGIQNVTLAKVILEKNGITDPKIIELPIGQHVAALAAGQVDAIYTLEPTGTIGRLKKVSRVLEAGVISKYVLGNANAPWFGGSASLNNAFIKQYPEVTKRYIAAYAKGIELVRKNPAEARQFLKGYTSIEADLVSEVPLPGFTLYNEFKPDDIAHFQKFFDVFTERSIFSRKVPVGPLLYKA